MATDTIQGIIGPNSVVDRSKLAKQGDAYDNLNMEDFVKLMVSELQNRSTRPTTKTCSRS